MTRNVLRMHVKSRQLAAEAAELNEMAEVVEKHAAEHRELAEEKRLEAAQLESHAEEVRGREEKMRLLAAQLESQAAENRELAEKKRLQADELESLVQGTLHGYITQKISTVRDI